MMIAEPARFVDTYIVDAKGDHWKTNLTSNIWTVTTTMDIDNEEYITLKENIHRQAFDQLEQYLSSNNNNARTAFNRSHATTLESTTSSNMSIIAFSAVGSAAGGTSTPDPSTKKFNLDLETACGPLTLCAYKHTGFGIELTLHPLEDFEFYKKDGEVGNLKYLMFTHQTCVYVLLGVSTVSADVACCHHF
jgi:hypothetical protein